MPREIIFDEIGIEERKLLLKAFDYDIDEEDYVLNQAGSRIKSEETPSEFLKVQDVALTPGSLNVIEATPTSISKFLREQKNKDGNHTCFPIIKKMNKDIKNLIIITIIAIGLRLLFLTKFPVGVDSFFFLEVARDCSKTGLLIYNLGCVLGEYGLTVFLAAISILTILLFYALCRTKLGESSSFYASILFALSPLIFSHTRFNMIDKDPMALFLIICLLIIFFCKIHEWLKLVLLLSVTYVFRYTWDGWIFMFFLVLILFIIKYIKEKQYYLFAFSLGVFVTYIYLEFFQLFKATEQYILPSSVSYKPLITETYTALQVGFLIEYILIAIVGLYLLYKLKDHLELATAFGISLVFFFITFRFNIFFVPVLYLAYGVMIDNINIKEVKYKYIITIVSAFLILIGGFGILIHPSIMSEKMYPVFDYINKQPTDCLINVWDKGHLYNYYTNKTVLFKASSYNYQEQIKYLVDGKATNCTIVFSNEDIAKLNKFVKTANLKIQPKDFYISIHINEFTNINGYYIK